MNLWSHRFLDDEDVICALATPAGEGALAIIRLSGKGAFKISKKLCPFLPKKIKSHHIYFGTLKNPQNNQALDEVLTLCFEQGKSFTGEESIEFSCHGGLFLSHQILEVLVQAGARLAKRGEFSYRAFMNGNIDLIQAESILNIIQSRSSKAHAQALKGLKGKASEYIKVLEKKLIKLLSHLEAAIDFSDQEIQPFSKEKQEILLQEIKQEIKKGIQKIHQGKINREGFSVILLGAPNAGKSSLFNYILQEDKAIITQYPGTTRDILTSRFLINQREFCLKDTAGFRDNPDPIETHGLQKVLQEIPNSNLCLFLVESKLPFDEKSFFYFKKHKVNNIVIVFSKADQLSALQKKEFLKQVNLYLNKNKINKKDLILTKKTNKEVLWISSKTGEGIEDIKQIFYKKSELDAGEIFLSTPRQQEALEKINLFLEQAEILLHKKSSPEFIAFELQSALSVLYDLLGKQYNEEIIKQIFKEFCLGK